MRLEYWNNSCVVSTGEDMCGIAEIVASEQRIIRANAASEKTHQTARPIPHYQERWGAAEQTEPVLASIYFTHLGVFV